METVTLEAAIVEFEEAIVELENGATTGTMLAAADVATCAAEDTVELAMTSLVVRAAVLEAILLSLLVDAAMMMLLDEDAWILDEAARTSDEDDDETATLDEVSAPATTISTHDS